jgi:hypothetical protein
LRKGDISAIQHKQGYTSCPSSTEHCSTVTLLPLQSQGAAVFPHSTLWMASLAEAQHCYSEKHTHTVTQGVPVFWTPTAPHRSSPQHTKEGIKHNVAAQLILEPFDSSCRQPQGLSAHPELSYGIPVKARLGKPLWHCHCCQWHPCCGSLAEPFSVQLKTTK